MTLTEKVAYLKGVMDGMNFDTAAPENKITKAIVDIIDDMAATISDLKTQTKTLGDYVEEIDQDLGDVEEYLYDNEDDEDECSCGCHDDEDEDEDEDDWDEDDEDDFVEVECPNCGEMIYFDETIDPSKVKCPNCQEEIDFVCDCCDLDDEEGCSCNCDDCKNADADADK